MKYFKQNIRTIALNTGIERITTRIIREHDTHPKMEFYEHGKWKSFFGHYEPTNIVEISESDAMLELL